MTAPEQPSPVSKAAPTAPPAVSGNRHRPAGGWARPDLLLLVGITLVAVVLRLWRLEQWSLSTTEAETWRGATESMQGAHGFRASDRSFYPLAFLGLRAMFESGVLPFHGEGWLRLPFAFFGILTVPLLAFVGNLFVARRVALFAAGLLALHPWHVAASQSASGEVAAVFFGLSAVGIAVMVHRQQPRWWGLLAGGLGLLAVGCHPSGWGALAAIGLGVVLARGPVVGRRRLLVLLGAVVAVWLPSVGFVAAGWTKLAITAPISLWEVVEAPRLAVWVLAACGLLLGVGVVRRPVERRWLLGAALLPFGSVVLGSSLGVPAAADHALLALPALLVPAAGAALFCFDHITKALGGGTRLATIGPGLLVATGLALDLAVETFLHTTVYHGHRADWRGARDSVMNAAGRSRAVTVLAGEGTLSLEYYLRPNRWRDPKVDAHPGIDLERLPTTGHRLQEILRREPPASTAVFLVLSTQDLQQLERDRAAHALLAEQFRILAVAPGVGTGSVYVLRRAPSEPR